MRVAVVDPGRQVPYYVSQLTRSLTAVGCDVTLHTGPLLYGQPEDADDRVTQRQSFGWLLGATSAASSLALRRPLPRRLLRAASYPFELSGFGAWCARHKPDVVHLQWSLAPPLDGAWVRALRRTGVSTVYTAHNVVPHETRPWHSRFHGWLHGSAGRVIVHSHATRDRLVDLGGADPDAVRIVRMPADETRDVPDRAEARASLVPPIGPKVPLVLFFGHVRRYKGLEVLLDAVPRLQSRIPTARVLVCGSVPGGDTGVRRLRGDLASRGVADAVDLRPGYADSSAMRACLAAADVIALPYRSASDSAVLAAARGHGRAVVASDVGSLAETLAEGGGIVVPAGDPVRLADALADVLEQPGTRKRLEEEARIAARAWTWRDAAEATLGVYRELATETAR